MYAVGGFNGSLRVRTVDCYDPATERWTCVSSMQDRRSTLGAAVLNGLLYAVGGFDGSTGKCVCVSLIDNNIEDASGKILLCAFMDLCVCVSNCALPPDRKSTRLNSSH